MAELSYNPPRFSSHNREDFGPTLRKRVNAHFKSNNISKTGDYRIWIKVILLPLFYLIPFVIIITNSFSNHLLPFYSLWLLMGLALAGCGLSVMHDACHGSLSRSKKVNNFIGASILNFAAGSSINWKIQHNVLHHSFTNIEGHDEDISPSGVMRFSPNQPKKKAFRFQAFYAWFFYGLMTFLWATSKDFSQLFRFKKMGLIESQGKSFSKELMLLIIRKVIYYAVFLVLPTLLLDVAWYHVIMGWFAMHFLAGLILAIIFQCAHVVPSTEFPLPNDDNRIENDPAAHQLMTTANFANNNRTLSWFVGGLNYQIEHHLFPNICHVHHRDISKIVKETAGEFGLPYHSTPAFSIALADHVKFLNRLGR